MFVLIMSSLLLLSNQILFAENHKSEDKMEEKKYSESEFHHKFAVELNGFVWSLLEKEQRTAEDDDMMIHAAHASHYHWSKIGTELNLQRGHWLLSRVYVVLNRPQAALYHAEKCLEITRKNGYEDFDLAYSYEAMARAYAASQNEEKWSYFSKLAKEAGEKIKEKEDKEYFLNDLQSEPWFGFGK
jgi:hypothetical protein